MLHSIQQNGIVFKTYRFQGRASVNDCGRILRLFFFFFFFFFFEGGGGLVGGGGC